MDTPSVPALLRTAIESAEARWAAILAPAASGWETLSALDLPEDEGARLQARLSAATAPDSEIDKRLRFVVERGEGASFPPGEWEALLDGRDRPSGSTRRPREYAHCLPLASPPAVLLLGGARDRALGAHQLTALSGIAAGLGALLEAERQTARADGSRRAEGLSLLSQVGQVVLGTLDLDELLQRLIGEIRRVVGAEAASVLLWDEADQALTFAASDGPGSEALLGLRVPQGQGIAGWVALNRSPALVAEAQADPRWYAKVDEAIAFRSRSLACVPIVRGARLVGVLEAVNKVNGEFVAHDLELLEAVSHLAAEAIVNARAFEAQRRQRQMAESLAEVSAILTATLDLSEVLARILDQVTRLAICADASIALRAGDEMRIAAVRERGTAAPGVRDSETRTRPGHTFLIADDPLTTEAMGTHAAAQRAATPGEPARLVVPLAIGERVIGQIALDAEADAAFTPDDLDSILALARPAAAAIENAHLYAEATRRLQEMTILHEVALATSATLDFDELVRRTAQTLLHSMDYEYAAIMLVDESGERLALHPASTGLPPEAARTTLRIGEGLAGIVARTGQPMRIDDATAERRFISLVVGAQSQIGVPLKVGDRVIGVLAVESTRRAAFGGEDERLLTIVARQLALALDNAQLFADVQARIAELRQAQAQLIQTEKVAAIGRLTASIAHEVNNPLQSIHNCLRLASENRLSPERQHEYLVMAGTEVTRLMEIVRRMLEFYRPAAAERAAVPVNALIEDVLALTGKQVRDARVELRRDLAAGLPMVSVVPNHLRQVFLNLILNAVEAMPAGGTLKIATASHDGDLRIRFEDSGGGIPASDLSKIFEPFFTTKDGGTGLGLSVTYGIVAAHGGWIDVESEAGRGTAFTVHLPVSGE